MPIGDEKPIQLNRKEWDCINNKIEDGYAELANQIGKMNAKLDKVLLKLYGDPEIKGDEGMYGEHQTMWKWYTENKFWKSKKKSVMDTIGWIVGLAGAIIAIILSSRQL